jgi:hypothetical protein
MQHIEQHFSGSDTVRDVVIGMADGLTVPFALPAGISGALTSSADARFRAGAERVGRHHAAGPGGVWLCERPLHRRSEAEGRAANRPGRQPGRGRGLRHRQIHCMNRRGAESRMGVGR